MPLWPDAPAWKHGAEELPGPGGSGYRGLHLPRHEALPAPGLADTAASAYTLCRHLGHALADCNMVVAHIQLAEEAPEQHWAHYGGSPSWSSGCKHWKPTQIKLGAESSISATLLKKKGVSEHAFLEGGECLHSAREFKKKKKHTRKKSKERKTIALDHTYDWLLCLITSSHWRSEGREHADKDTWWLVVLQ